MPDQDGRELDYQTIRQGVVRRLRKRILFFAHASLWAFFLTLTQRYFSPDASRFIAVMWLLVLIVHFIYAFDIWSRIVERSTQGEMERLQKQGYRVASSQGAKLKRQQVARLSDDGEIVYEDEPALKTARSGQDDVGGRA